jgi:RNA polymerase sigma factor (TIGR02999 family)
MPKNRLDSLMERRPSSIFHIVEDTIELSCPLGESAAMGHGDITELLKAHAAGDADALHDLLPRVYDELRRMAHRRMQEERAGHTFSTTALVHEAYLELVDLDRIDWKDRTHFFALAARVMRNVLVDYAVKRNAKKRGGDQDHVPLRDEDAAEELHLDDVLSVHQALQRLAEIDERQARVVECRFFGGLTIDETAEALNISPATVGRDWRVARAWLNRELTNEKDGGPDEQPHGA